MLRFLRYVIEIIAAFVGVGIVLAVLLVWRLSVHPITSDFMTPYVEAVIEEIIPDSEVHVDATLLTWSGIEHSISVHADHIKITDAKGTEIADVPMLDANISVIGLLFGQLMPKDLMIDHPQLKLLRNANGSFVFGGMAMGGGSDKTNSSNNFKDVFRKAAYHLTHAALMNHLEIKHAVFDVHDEGTQNDWAISIPEISLTRKTLSAVDHKLEYGALEGRATVEVTQKDDVASVDIEYSYDPKKEHHNLSTVFTDLTPAFVAGGHPETLGLSAASIFDLPLTGKIVITLDKDFAVQSLSALVHGDQGHLVYKDFWDDPCPVKSVDINLDFDSELHKLKISDTHIDLDGPFLSIAVDGFSPVDQKNDLDFSLALVVENMPMNRYGELWPKTILPDPRWWLATNLRDGMLPHSEMTLKGALSWKNAMSFSVSDGGGKMTATNARVGYVPGMPPVENVNAEATFDLKTMAIRINSGNIGNIRVVPFTLQINGLSEVDQDVDIPLQVTGPLPEVMQLLDHPPLGYAKMLGLSPSDLAGTISGTVDFAFPLANNLDMNAVNVKATANAEGVASSKLIPGLTIDQGNLALTLDKSGFGLRGQTLINKVPFQVGWQEIFAPQSGKAMRQVSVTGSIKDDQWANFGISAFDGTKGTINLALDMTKPTANKMIFVGSLDMTQAAMKVDMLDWKKPANSPALLKFTADAPLGKPVSVNSLSLRGQQIKAEGKATLSSDMSKLLSLNLSSLVLGKTNASLQYSQNDDALSFDVSGASFDISGLRGGNDPDREDARPKDYHIKVSKLYTSTDGEIDNAAGSATRDKDGWSEISLHGLADLDMPVSIELALQSDGHRTLSILCDDFGKAMKGLGFTDTIKGGKLEVTGASTIDAPRVIVGTAKIKDFTIQRLPVLALLMNATSPFGFSGILTDSADFSRFEGDFRWQGDEISLTRAHAVGSAIGINVDGKVDMNTGEANLQGTLVPFSTVNNMLNYIPLIGGLITGGQDQGVLAVSYQIKGSLSAPHISVNPVSLLTPGFIRNLFFRDNTADDK
jgi:hypothetical protein